MNTPLVSIRLGGDERSYWPGDTLSGEYQLEGMDWEEVEAIEVSVLWYSEGKGDEDLAVHYFRRVQVGDDAWSDPRQPGSFETVLPNSPLSYQGVIVKIRWCVRVRVFLAREREVVGERAFQLGQVHPMKAVVP